jgi:hypothetical protein
MPTPRSTIALRQIIKNLAGDTFVITWIIYGIPLIGNTNPERITDGSSEKNVAMENATC